VVIEDHVTDDARIDISHESLIRQWDSLRNWVDEEAESRRIYRDIVDSVERKKGLWRDPYLQVALDWRDRTQPSVAWARRYGGDFAAAMGFLDESRQNRDREALEKLKQQRLKRRLTSALLILSILFGGVVALLFQRAAKDRELAAVTLARAQEARIAAELATREAASAIEEAARQRDRAARSEATAAGERRRAGVERARASGLRLGLEALRHFDDSADGLVRSALIAIEALRMDETAQGMKALYQALRLIPRLEKIHSAHKGIIREIEFSRDGRWMAIAGYQDSTVSIWDVSNGRNNKTVLKLPTPMSLAFSPDSRWLAVGGSHAVWIWDLAASRFVGEPIRHRNIVRSVAFSPDGSFLATATQAAPFRIFSASDWTEQRNAPDTKSDAADGAPWAYDLAYMRDKLLLALPSGLRQYDAENVIRDTPVRNSCYTLAVHREKSLVAAACADGIVTWDLSGEPHVIPARPRQQLARIALSRDGELVAV
jgi:hypothetical protein